VAKVILEKLTLKRKQFPFSNVGSQVQTEKWKTECGKAGMLALQAKKRRENATT